MISSTVIFLYRYPALGAEPRHPLNMNTARRLSSEMESVFICGEPVGGFVEQLCVLSVSIAFGKAH